MPYVKISDPNIIDLAAWHQLINVVNQHSDSINSITNNFGVQGTGSIDWEADTDGVHEFVMGSEKILYGRTKIDTATALSNTGDQIFRGEVDFGDNVSGATTFSARPIVVATIQFGHQTYSPNLEGKNHNIVFNIYGVSKNNFNYRVTRATSTTAKPDPLTGFFYLNWQAIGPK